MTLIAVSGDPEARQAAFRRALGAEFAFVADLDGALMRAYGVKLPLLRIARRTTFVIGRGRHIIRVDRGGDALEVGEALGACLLA